MFKWLWKFLTDDTFFGGNVGVAQEFVANHAAWIRAFLVALAGGTFSGLIPTGVNGGGKPVAIMLAILAAALRAGDKNVVTIDDAGQIVPVKAPGK